MSKPENFLVACDIGTTKICVLIGEQNANGSLDASFGTSGIALATVIAGDAEGEGVDARLS